MRYRNAQVLLSLIMVLFLYSCASEGDLGSKDSSTSQGGSDQIPLPSTEKSQDIDGNNSLSDQGIGDGTVSPTITESSPETSPPIDNRLTPEEWQSWPIIPTLSPAMIEVYQVGIELGNRPEAFSKVGDCQIIPEVFLGFYDDFYYALPEEQKHLQEALDYFSGSFAREGMALKGGFVFPTVFSPLRADSSVCDPGETPFECELRVHQPTFVLISMEFRYEGRTAETHEKYLRQSVEYTLSRGMVPILATKADNFEGDHSLNLKTAQIAYEYDVPLWNFWRAVQHLPDHGIDWERDSYGFHVTTAAWYERSHSFLIVLDSLWKEINANN